MWDRAKIDEGQDLVRECLRRNRPGSYQIQAAIQAVHADARRADDTDWRQIALLYDHLLAIAPSPIAALNRAVAIAEVDGPGTALGIVDALALDTYHLFHAIRADLLRRLARNDEAAAAYDAAIARAENARERAFLLRRRASVTKRSARGQERPSFE
jgi:RNA polymerase sigma-70 factor (ECF subfamily)